MDIRVHRRPLPPLGPEHGPYLAAPEVGDGTFRNPWGVVPDRGLTDVLRWKLGPNPFSAQKLQVPDLPVLPDAERVWTEVPGGARVQWLGHATVLVEIDGVTVIIDPVFGRAGPVPRAVRAPVAPRDLPRVDAILVTHGHYDHLDVASMRAVLEKSPDALVLAPRGQGKSLPRAARRRAELSWWDEVEVGGVRLCLVPAQHWHRRNPLDHNEALWGGYVVQGTRSLYHTGDTGHFGGFATIGAAFGGVDVAVLPIGAYEPRWFMGSQHMAPEESLAAFRALGARAMLGMHWGTFDLTDEPLDHGARALLGAAAREQGVPLDPLFVLAHGGVLDFREPLTPRAWGRIPVG